MITHVQTAKIWHRSKSGRRIVETIRSAVADKLHCMGVSFDQNISGRRIVHQTLSVPENEEHYLFSYTISKYH